MASRVLVPYISAATVFSAAKAGEGRDKINDWAEQKVEAECKAGLLLRQIEREPRKRTDLSGSDDPMKTPYQIALSEARLPPDMAHRWQIESWLPQSDRAAYYAEQRAKAKIITSEDRMGKKLMPHETVEPVDIDGKYSVIVIDPHCKR